jgi:hypothetical protein
MFSCRGFGFQFPDALQSPLGLQAKLLVHVIFNSQDRSLVPHWGFRIFNEKMKTSSRLAIPRIPTRSLLLSPPGSAPDPRDHYLVTITLPLIGVSGFPMPKCIYPRDSRLLESRLDDSWPHTTELSPFSNLLTAGSHSTELSTFLIC